MLNKALTYSPISFDQADRLRSDVCRDEGCSIVELHKPHVVKRRGRRPIKTGWRGRAISTSSGETK